MAQTLLDRVRGFVGNIGAQASATPQYFKQIAEPKLTSFKDTFSQRMGTAAGNPTLNKIVKGDINRITLPESKAQNPWVRYPLNFAKTIPESIINIPRNLAVGPLRVAKEINEALDNKRAIKLKNIATGVAPFAEGAIDTATFGFLTPLKQLGKEAVKTSVKQAARKGVLTGAKYGAFNGLTYGVDQQYNKDFDLGEVALNVGAGATLGSVLGGGVAGISSLASKVLKPKTQGRVIAQLRDSAGRWTAEQTPIKPKGMTKAQWDFQLDFNKKYNRNPYTPVFAQDLVEAANYESGKRIGMQARNINLDKKPLSTSFEPPVARKETPQTPSTFTKVGDIQNNVRLRDLQSTYGKLLATGNQKRIRAFEKKYIKDVKNQPNTGFPKQSQSLKNQSKQLSQAATTQGKPTFYPSKYLDSRRGKLPLVPQTPRISDKKPLDRMLNSSQDIVALGSNLKERKFARTVRESPKSAPEVSAKIQSFYNPISNKQSIAEADAIINKNLDEAIDIAKNGESTATNNAVAMRLAEKFQKEGNYTQALDVLESLAKKPTAQGQAIQILSYWSRLTPTGAIKYAQRLAERANAGKTGKKIVVTSEKAKKIAEIAKQVQNLPDGRERVLKTAELLKEAESVVPPTLGQKIGTIQTIAQLLNPKTAIRNIGGNAMFTAGEYVSDVVASVLDLPVSMVTGKRSKAFPNLSTQIKGFGTGLKEGTEEALRGISLGDTGKQFEMQNTQVFTDPILGTLEKALGVELRSMDKAFYKAAFDDSLRSQLKVSKVDTPTEEMIRVAHLDGLYRTFQDETTLSKAFQGIKKAFNGGRDFGLGDLILKYPKTPANIIMRGLDYSPVGLTRSVFEIAKPFMGQAFDQKAFVESLARASVGSASLIGTGYFLYKAGIISGSPSSDKDIRAVEKEMGQGGYKLNVSALKRFVLGGLRPELAKPQENDTLVSYDWAQPFAITLSMGANIAEKQKRVTIDGQVASLIDAVQGGVNTIQEQPLVTGVAKFFRSGDIGGAVSDAAKSTPASFVPTLLNQINQFADNTPRETYSPDLFEESMNMAKARIPGLAQDLPARSTVLGGKAQRYQDGSNTFFNVFLNPAFVTKIKSNPGAEEVLRIYQQSGETQQAPRLVDRKIKVNGVDRELTGEEISVYQDYVGTRANFMLNSIINESWWNEMADSDKATHVSKLLSDINTIAKVELFGDTRKLSLGERLALEGKYNIPSAFKSKAGSSGKKNKKVSFGSLPKLPTYKPPKLSSVKRTTKGRGKKITLKDLAPKKSKSKSLTTLSKLTV